MSWKQPRTLDEVSPAVRAKGHLQVGADADVVVLDPAAVTDAATYLDSARPAHGVRHLMVNGTLDVKDGQIELDAYPGKALRGEPR